MIPEKLNVGPSDIIRQHEVKRELDKNQELKEENRQTINSSITESS